MSLSNRNTTQWGVEWAPRRKNQNLTDGWGPGDLTYVIEPYANKAKAQRAARNRTRSSRHGYARVVQLQWERGGWVIEREG